MSWVNVGEKVRIDIPDKEDPDYDRLHNETGRVIDIVEDEAGQITGDERDNQVYRIQLETDEVVSVRWRDIRPV